MKLNFWQWIGIFIVLVALIVIVRREMGERGVAPDRSPNPAPQSSPHPAVEVPSTQTAAPTTGPAAP
jgi:hypothetical protein